MKAADTGINKMPALELLKIMALAREGDRREGILLRQSKGLFQIGCSGHEALAMISFLLKPEDYLYLYYRDRALALARGITNYEMALSFFSKGESSSMGRQMPNHYSCKRHNIVSVGSPTGMQCLPAAGTAWAQKLNKTNSVTVCTLGDAATRQGEFYESICFALEEKLPLIMVVEDNGYGISTPTSEINPVALGAFGGDYLVKVDGRDINALYTASVEAVNKARNGEGPTLLWVELDRLASHTSSDDHRVYRSKEEIDDMNQRDPIDLLRDELIQKGELNTADWEKELARMAKLVDEDYKRAENTPEPKNSEVCSHLTSDQLPSALSGLEPNDGYTMVESVNLTLNALLEKNDKVIMFGEDIADPKGGVFGLTKGLSDKYPDRVSNSPLAEATIAGVACGLALAGWNPIFEMQFVDFMGPALQQIIHQISTLRWRSGGEWKCPLVILAPCGAYLPGGGMWHSQTNEAFFAHSPGLHVVMPSDPQDASALLNASVAGDDPVIFMLPKHLYRKRADYKEETPLRLGSAAIRRTGDDATIVAWGNCVEVAMEASIALAADGVNAEVIDLRSIAPWDRETIAASLTKTGRLAVIQEDSRTCGFGQAIIAELTTSPESWDLFAAPPVLLSKPDVHIPFNAQQEEHILPSASMTAEAVLELMRY